MNDTLTDPHTPGLSDATQADASEALLARVERECGRAPARASLENWMRTTAHACRADLAERMNQTLRSDREAQRKRVHYLSMEFLMGRALSNALDESASLI